MIFEYKVKCMHGTGWKEIKLYADTDIEEFFNRNSIKYVRNMIDTIENSQLKEIKRLNNIINETRRILGEYKHFSTPTEEQNSENEEIVDKAYIKLHSNLQELKGDSSNE